MQDCIYYRGEWCGGGHYYIFILVLVGITHVICSMMGMLFLVGLLRMSPHTCKVITYECAPLFSHPRAALSALIHTITAEVTYLTKFFSRPLEGFFLGLSWVYRLGLSTRNVCGHPRHNYSTQEMKVATISCNNRDYWSMQQPQRTSVRRSSRRWSHNLSSRNSEEQYPLIYLE